MKRALLRSVGVLLVLVLSLVGLVNVLAPRTSELPPPDLDLAIALPDGSERRLGDLMAPWTGEPPAEPELGLEVVEPRDAPTVGSFPLPEAEGLEPREVAELMIERALRESSLPPDGSDPFALAEWHRRVGDLSQARALYQALPEWHPRWGRAQRRLAWDVLTRAEDEPAQGVPYAHKALADDPLDGNAWQDAARVYAATLGWPVD